MENLKQNKKELWIMLGGVTIILGGVVFYKFYWKEEKKIDYSVYYKSGDELKKVETKEIEQEPAKNYSFEIFPQVKNERMHPREGKEEL